MKRSNSLLFSLLLVLVPLLPVVAQDSTGEQKPGKVEIPLEIYNSLVDAARHPTRSAPASFALGSARVTITVGDVEPRATADVRVDLSIDVFENQWTLVPVLPVATPVEIATVDGTQVQLITTPSGLAWSTEKKGAYRMILGYRVDSTRSTGGYSLPLPLPEAASITLTANLPGTDLDVAVIPAAGVRTTVTGPSGNRTEVKATIPTTDGVNIAWRAAVDSGPIISRAQYQGELRGEAIVWHGELDVELFDDEAVTLKLLPRGVTLERLEVDGKRSAILVEGDSFATPLRGRGRHVVVVSFQSSVLRSDGPPQVTVRVPQVPVSRFDLTLPGKKEVTVTPAANVSSREQGGSTVATVFAPLTSSLGFSWAEAVPEEVRAEVRANAGVYHAVYAEEGVLSVRAFVLFEITRGETNIIRFDAPAGVHVNRITAASGAVADWRIEADEGRDDRQLVTVFLDRKVRDELLFEVYYDRSLSATGVGAERFEVPLIEVVEAHRQRGMVALLSSKDLTLDPVEEGGATRVGENQLPPYLRSALGMTVAHTFKYVEEPPSMVVQAIEPEREQGRFDAQIDTLVSLEDVALEGSATVELNVKSGRIMELELTVPLGVNILNLNGPSIRTFRVVSGADAGASREGDDQRIEIEFTQEMEGQFRLEVGYELILDDLDSDGALTVPTLTVVGAEVEQGKIAVEALSAVEIQALENSNLTALDISELPQQLVLRTTNPILLAYKYVHSEPEYNLVLEITRHQLIDVQEAAIDSAEYRTLFTDEGLAVTTAHFVVRNSRKQFLRIQLPAGAEVWSAFVDGRPEKPAAASDQGDERDERSILLKIVNSTDGFPVDVIFATPGARIGGLGTVVGMLPRPDILVTESRWDVYLPPDLRYGKPRSNMTLTGHGSQITGSEVAARMASEHGGEHQAIQPLRISVPTAGIQYSFEKLYSNQSEEDAWFAISYASRTGATLGLVLSLVGTVLIWGGLALSARPAFGVSQRVAVAIAVVGAVLLVITVGFYHVSSTPAVLLTVLLAVVVVGRYGWAWRQQQRA